MPTDPIQALLGAGVVPSVAFPPTSRYAQVGVATYARVAAPGEEPVPVAFLRRRLAPSPNVSPCSTSTAASSATAVTSSPRSS